MTALDQLDRLWRHALWADAMLLDALRAAPDAAPAWREYAHLLGAASVWLARLRGEPPQSAIWPAHPRDDVEALHGAVHAAFGTYLAGLRPEDLERRVPYTNSAGQAFTTGVGDILLHLMLHGQYHRGKVNLLLREAGAVPAPADYVAFVRGAPAATTPVRTP